MTTAAKLTGLAIKSFILAGNATFTVKNTATGNRFTFRVIYGGKAETEPKPSFVKVLTGPENTRDYTFIGTIFNRAEYRHGRRSQINRAAPSARAAEWFLTRVLLGVVLPDCIEVWHQGKCGRCGRALTVPTSLLEGLGPECSARGELARAA